MDLGEAIRSFVSAYFAVNDRRAKTQAAYVSDLSQFHNFLGGDADFLALGNSDIERWAAGLKLRGYAPASIRRKIVVLKVFFKFWVRKGLIAESPFGTVQVDYGKVTQLPRTITENEIQQFFSQAWRQRSLLSSIADEASKSNARGDYLILRNIALLELLFATGMRVGEASAVNVSDFVIAESMFKVNGKGGKERLAFVVDKVATRILGDHLAARQRISTESPALFLNAKGDRLSAQGIADAIRRMRKESGIDRHITPHMFRHTIATLLLRNGMDIRVVQEFLGHASIATTQRYTHVAKEHMIRELKYRHPSITFRVDDARTAGGFLQS